MAVFITDARLDPSLDAEFVDGGAVNTELSGDLFDGEHSGVEQSLFEALDFGGEAYPLNTDGIEIVAGAGAQSAIVEDAGNLRIGVFIQKNVDVMANVFMSGTHL